MTVIESLGVYLPPREVLTEDVVRGCRRKMRFPLERLSGIVSRRVAGESEYGIDLAKQAIRHCLATSKYAPQDVDILISTSTARCDGPPLWISFEPSTAFRIKADFGFTNALAFDIASACSGMFAAINIVDALLQQGVIENGLVVSGEYISHLAATAQLEIDGLLDHRLACLTLGDAGAAVMLEAGPAVGVGFEALELRTFGGYAGYCTAAPTTEAHGGGIMFTDALRLTEAATRAGSAHALETLQRAGWMPDSFQHLIMHQTSSTGMASARREINRLLRGTFCHEGNTIDNLAHRGNTATTTHFVALADAIQSGRIRSGDRVIFAISGSGLTVGTALYTLDDLPDRVARLPGTAEVSRRDPRPRSPQPRTESPRIRIASVGSVRPSGNGAGTKDSLTLLRLAATDCLGHSSYKPDDIGLVIHAGVYRSGFVCEPAVAAMLAGELAMNPTPPSADGRQTLAFDVLNGAVSFLSACHVAIQMLRAGKARTAMVAAAEIENNRAAFPDELLGLQEAGSAVLLDAAPGNGTGFGSFAFRSFPQHVDAFTSHCTNKDGKAYLQVASDARLERYYLEGIRATVDDLLRREGLDLSRIATILPPQRSASFLAELSAALNVPRDRFVEILDHDGDLYTSSLPFAFQALQCDQRIRPGDIGLLIAAGSGIQVACALYYF